MFGSPAYTALGPTCLDGSLELAADTALDGIHPDAHELEHGVRRRVLGPHGSSVSAPGPVVVRVDRPADEGLYQAALGLVEEDHVGARRVDDAVTHEVLLRRLDLYALDEELANHLGGGHRVVLAGGDDVGGGSPAGASLRLPLSL